MGVRSRGTRVGFTCCLSLLLMGCAAASAPVGGTAVPAAVTGASVAGTAMPAAVAAAPVAGPTEAPCVAPSETDVRDEAAGSDAVVTGHVSAAPTSSTAPNGQVFDTVTVAVSQVVSTAPSITVGASVHVVEAGGGPRPMLPVGDYLLFLTRAVDRSSYFATNGLPGIFAIGSNGRFLSRTCPNIQDPASPSAVPGTSMPTLDTVESWVPASLSGGMG